MIEFNSYYDDFIRHLASIGFESRMEDREINFPSYHNTVRTETVPVRVIVCPVTGRAILAKTVFDCYLKRIMLQIFFTPDRLTIHSVFNEIQE